MNSSGVRVESSQGAVMSLENGKIAIGNNIAELADLVDQILKALDKFSQAIQIETHNTAVGPTSPPVNAAAYILFQATLTGISTQLSQIKGSV